MAYENSVAVAGNLTRDPETKEVADGTVTTLGVAVDHRNPRVAADAQQEVSFFAVTAFGHLSKGAAGLRKGDRVVVVGRLKQGRWVADDGANRSSVEIVAEDIGRSVLF